MVDLIEPPEFLKSGKVREQIGERFYLCFVRQYCVHLFYETVHSTSIVVCKAAAIRCESVAKQRDWKRGMVAYMLMDGEEEDEEEEAEEDGEADAGGEERWGGGEGCRRDES